ncbi:eukaryotic translation initiation factor 4E-2 [Catenaria anguillulae PL171]|uniref:Eukaryotic translation initiation factor 4E-2 n=1 Tax=Catenaria anguillulae PL171 TaxID=765915 RepID=A0A1Y2HDH8_9FUNG|nr:eukaryotic translation initiation factor 4E-2 [Catenaria anguillulae PL171]
MHKHTYILADTHIMTDVAPATTSDAGASHTPAADVHPLNGKWTLSYTGPTKSKNWEDNVKKVATIGTVEEFWGSATASLFSLIVCANSPDLELTRLIVTRFSLFNNIPKVDDLANSSDYNLFREGIFPGWEDKANCQGGKWLVPVPGNDLSGLSRMWLESCLFAIGEQFHDTQEICGIVVSVRSRGHKLCLWTRTALDVEKTQELGRKWKAAIGLDSVIKYQVHSESISANKSFPKGDAYTV